MTAKIMVNVLKFQTFFSFCSLNKMLVKQTGKTLIRLLLQKQSDLGLRSLSMSFLQTTSV